MCPHRLGSAASRRWSRLRYEEIDNRFVEKDGESVFGDIVGHARYKYLLSLEGHSYWSFRIRHLLHLNSAVLHQARAQAVSV